MSAHALGIWTLFDHPEDYPDCFVARLSLVRQGSITVLSDKVITADSLDDLRNLVQAECPNVLTAIPRHTSDVPSLVECLL